MLSFTEVDELILECKTDIGALEKLYYEFKNDVIALSMSIVRDLSLAEDVLQESFLRLKALSGKYIPQEKGKIFILKIAANVSREFLRKNKKTVCFDETLKIYTPNDFLAVEAVVVIESIIKHLNEKESEIISLKFYSGLTFKEIAYVLHISESTAKWRYESALNKLREHCFKEDFYG